MKEWKRVNEGLLSRARRLIDNILCYQLKLEGTMKKGTSWALGLAMVFMMTFVVGLTASAEAVPPIKVGEVSGWDYAGGQGVKRGVQMAIRDINAAGGLLGRQVECVFYDNRGDVEEAKKATERLLYKDKVEAIFGFWRSDLAIVCQPLIMEAKKIMFIGGASAPVLTYERIAKDYKTYKYTFATQPNATYLFKLFEQPIIIAREKLGLNKLAIVGEKAASYDPVHDYLVKKYADILINQSRFTPDAIDFTVEFSNAKAAGANLLFVYTTGKAGTAMVKQWHDMQLPMLKIGYNVDAQDPNFWKMTEGKCDGVQTDIVGASRSLPITEKSVPWYESYKKMFGEPPIVYNNPLSYDSVMAWAEGVKLAGTADPDAVVKALESDKFRYVGVTAAIDRFDKIHNPAGSGWTEGEAWGFVVTQWQNGKMEVIYPEKVKTADMIIPARVKKLMGK